MSEWEEFAAYTIMIKRAKLEERNRILYNIADKLMYFSYWDGSTSQLLDAQLNTKEECLEALLKMMEDSK